MATLPSLRKSSRDQNQKPFVTTPVVVLLVILGIVCSFFAISQYRVFTLHEVLAASTSRAMYTSGDYVIPYESGIPRLNKPPLAYWIITASASLTGQVDEYSARIPSAIFSLLLAALIGHWVARWYGKQAGYLAGFVQATCYYSLLWSRKTEVDMCLTFINVAALYLIANQPPRQSWKQGFLRWTGIFLLMGLSVLAKFYYGPVLVFGIVGVYWWMQGRLQDLKHACNPVGWILCLAPFAIWAWAVTLQLPGAWQIWKTETVGRALGEVGYSPIWFYVPESLWVTLPWTPIWLIELRNSWKFAWKDCDSRERFLWIWFLVPFVIVTLQPDKHTNYMMTFLPVFSILAGRRLAQELTPERWLSFQWSRKQAVSITILNVAVGILAFVLLDKFYVISLTAALAAGGLISVGFSTIAWLFYAGRQSEGVLACAVCYTGVIMFFFGGLQPARDSGKIHAEFAQRVHRKFPDQQIIGYHLSRTACYYLGEGYIHITKENSEEQIRQAIQDHSYRLFVSSEEHLDDFRRYGKLTKVMSIGEQLRKNWDGKKPLPACWRLEKHQHLDIAVEPNSSQSQ